MNVYDPKTNREHQSKLYTYVHVYKYFIVRYHFSESIDCLYSIISVMYTIYTDICLVGVFLEDERKSNLPTTG